MSSAERLLADILSWRLSLSGRWASIRMSKEPVV